jgi:hypothetical protein
MFASARGGDGGDGRGRLERWKCYERPTLKSMQLSNGLSEILPICALISYLLGCPQAISDMQVFAQLCLFADRYCLESK